MWSVTLSKHNWNRLSTPFTCGMFASTILNQIFKGNVITILRKGLTLEILLFPFPKEHRHDLLWLLHKAKGLNKRSVGSCNGAKLLNNHSGNSGK
jgi:hypothetical protein